MPNNSPNFGSTIKAFFIVNQHENAEREKYERERPDRERRPREQDEQDKLDEIRRYHEIAEAGYSAENAAAQYELGRIYIGIYPPVKDYRKAAEWFRRAAKNGHAGAQRYLELYQFLLK